MAAIAVAAGRGIVVPDPFGRAISCFVIVGREEEAAGVAIGELREHHVGQADGRVDPALVEAGFVERDQRHRQSRRSRRDRRRAWPGRAATSAAAGRRAGASWSRMKSAARRGRREIARLVQRTGRRCARASIIRPFQLTSTLSSRPGRTRACAGRQQLRAPGRRVRLAVRPDRGRKLRALVERLGQIQDVAARSKLPASLTS